MIDLRSYLKSQIQPIVDFIQGRYISENVTTEETFNQIVTKLQRGFIHNHRGDTDGRDQAHNVLTMAIICAMWCGCLSQAKTNRYSYPQEWLLGFKKAIIDAFEIGQEYSVDRH